jgi:hypothetical protein
MADNIKIVGQVTDTSIVTRYSAQDEQLLLPILQQDTFGQLNDYIEYFVFDLGGSVLNSDYNYKSYKLPTNTGYSQSLLPSIEINPVQDIENLGYQSGNVTSRYNFFRKVSGQPFDNQLFIQQISTDRTEIRVNSTILSNEQLLGIVTSFTQKQESVSYYYYVILNFGNNNQSIAVNALSSIDDNGDISILFKLYEPLPVNFDLKSTFWIVEEIINPYIFDISLNKLITPAPQPQLRGPNFDVDIQRKGVIPTQYSNYNQLITALTGSQYRAVLNALTNQNANINVDYSIINEFVHYSSAESRLYNFMFKIGEIESYQAEINTNTPLTASNTALSASVNRASSSINTIIGGFDGFESYLYFASSSLTSSIKEYTLETGSFFEYLVAPYPKSNSTQPYTLYASSSLTTQNWYATASNVALAYDLSNKDLLLDVIPSYVREDVDNYYPYITFVNMVGQYFDNIWLYINELPALWDNNNNLYEGISPDLVYDWLESFGVKLYNSQGDQSYLDYAVGGYSGSIAFNGDYSPSSSFLNNVPRKDLVTDTYKRIYHNLPYLFKAKGSHGGLQGLITSFGVTGSILPIKEYGGTTDYQDLKGYSPDKIRISSNSITGSVLSPIKRLETTPTSSRDIRSQDLHFIDVSFSPQTQIDAAVSASITAVSSSWVIDQYIGDPTDLQLNTYPSLSFQKDYWFGQTFDEPFDYGGFIRLIQFFDNSLFKMVKDFTPARGNTWTGVSIKSPVLERPKVAQYNPNMSNIQEYDAPYTGAAILPVYDPYYFYLAGDKIPYYNGNISGSFIDTYAYFEAENRNPYLVNNTIGYVPPGFVSGNTDFILDYNAPRYENFFLNSDFNTLQNNIDVSLTSEFRKKLTPIMSVDNLGRTFTSYSITESVELQDSYLTTTAYVNPRYEGVQMYSRFFNTWSFGDNSYGQSPVIDYNVKKLGLFTEVVTNPYLPYKSNVNLKYLVDETGRLTELNKRNRNWVEVQNTFETGDTLNISLFDVQKFSNQVQTNGNKIIAESGYSYFPVFYAYGSESISNPTVSASWTASAVFSAPDGVSQNILDNYFTVYPLSSTIVPSLIYTSSSYSSSKFEVWDLFNYGTSDSYLGNYFITGSGPGISDVTSSYYIIPQDSNYQFTYDFSLAITASAGANSSVTGSMELWLSSSAGFSVVSASTLTAGTDNFQVNAYRAILGSIPRGFLGVDARPTNETFIALNGYTIYEYDIANSLTPVNSVAVIGDTTYIKYSYFGYSRILSNRQDDSLANANTDNVEQFLGDFWVKSTDNPNNYNNITLYSDISSIATSSPGNVNVDMLFRQTVNFDNSQISPSDKIVFRFFIQSSNTTITASIKENGSLRAIPTNAAYDAENIQICVDQANNAFYLNSSLSQYFGPAFIFNPLDSSVSSSYSTLYTGYGDILYPFSLNPNDKIVVQVSNTNGPILEYTVNNVFFNGAGLAYINVKEDIDGYFGNLCSKYYKILFLKRVIDETNIIIELSKPSGKTSYGFSIPQNISPAVLNNIDMIQKNVNAQLIDVGVGVTT